MQALKSVPVIMIGEYPAESCLRAPVFIIMWCVYEKVMHGSCKSKHFWISECLRKNTFIAITSVICFWQSSNILVLKKTYCVVLIPVAWNVIDGIVSSSLAKYVFLQLLVVKLMTRCHISSLVQILQSEKMLLVRIDPKICKWVTIISELWPHF